MPPTCQGSAPGPSGVSRRIGRAPETGACFAMIQVRVSWRVSEAELEREAVDAAQVTHVGERVVQVGHADHGYRETQADAGREPLGIVIDVVTATQEHVLAERILRADV